MPSTPPPEGLLLEQFRGRLPGDETVVSPAAVARAKTRIQVRRFAGPAHYTEHLSHLRIAHLTDLHVGRVTPWAVQLAAVELTNAEKPDLVLLTGDFVCHSQQYLDRLEALVQRFEAPVMAVLGNHDYWSGAEEVREALRRGGVEILDNRHTIIGLRHQMLQVVGLDDAYTGHARRDEALKGLRRDLPTIAMSHIAEEADGLWAQGDIPLVLSGHTHAGQVTLARLHELAIGKLAGHRYVHGLYGSRRSGGAHPGAVYVGAGIGASVMPIRLGERGQREVAIFELGYEPGAIEEHHDEQDPLPGRPLTPEIMAKRAAAVVAKREKRERKKPRTS
ncbi:metallophosphoesterase [Polyangium sp. y55x31]|uniref:metallophosphoesterase n=1 Tax=Polyangium sp. y55x31 TaxID=3042688 RepID=UPI002482FADC|nr:metallophosphoesterase [Polyangium sp. y55x31]MDI1481659.1 metallophosphoesterase [Polyangium sp. y55x31]